MNKKNKKKCEGLKALTSEDRQMMFLRLKGKTHKEIADITGHKPDAIRQRFSTRLNEKLKDLELTFREINWEFCQKELIASAFDLLEQTDDTPEKRQILATLSKLLKPFTPKDKQSNVADIHIRILTAKEAEKAKENGENVIAIDDYFNEGKDEEQ